MTPSTSIVLKFGGTSVGSPERIRAVAKIVAGYRRRFEKVAVVVSAMGHTTDELISLALQVSPKAQSNRREMDMLLSAGERISMALLSLALADEGVQALSFTGSQSGIITDTVHGEARIADIRPFRILESLERGKVVIVAGFQGVSHDKEITTLGRGGSDTSAVALGVALKSDRVVIFTDVDGFYSADPNKVPSARKRDEIGWDTALLGAHFGAQVLHPRCVELGARHGLAIEVKSSFRDSPGTLVKGVDSMSLEGPKVLAVTAQRGLLRARAEGVGSDKAATTFAELRRRGVKILAWNCSDSRLEVLFEGRNELPADLKAHEEKVARVALVGTGLLGADGVLPRLVEFAASEGLTCLASEAGPTHVSIVVNEALAEKIDAVVRKTHDEFVSA